MKQSIFDMLCMLGLSSKETREVYSIKTRDISPVTVYKDKQSGVIFIEDYYTGDSTYKSGKYLKEIIDNIGGTWDLERHADASRRSKTYKQFYFGKDIADFGCGYGDFLRVVKQDCSTLLGIELQQDLNEALNKDGIKCVKKLNEIHPLSLDVIFSFHVIEHFPTPINYLIKIRQKLREGGCVVIEVPHANDFLFSVLENESFKNFTLWSQHLVLHTRYSLKKLLEFCGFKEVLIEGIQRFSLSNHLQWLSRGLPSGHKSKLSLIDDDNLNNAYSSALNRIDATDTIVAIAYT